MEMPPPPAAAHGLGFAELIAYSACVMALSALSVDIMLPAQGSIGEDFGRADPNDGQLVVFAFLAAYGLVHPFAGPLADRFGRRAVVLGALAAYAIAAALAAFSPSFALLIAARAGQGLAVGAARVAIMAMVRDEYAGRRMSQVVSIATIVFMMAPILAPSIGQAVLASGSWRVIFVGLLVYAIILAIWTLSRVGETLDPSARKRFSFNAAFGSYAEFFRNRASLGYTLVSALLFGGFFSYLGTAQQIYVDIFGIGEKFPIAFAVGAVPFMAAAILNARIVMKLGMRRIVHAAIIGLIAVNALHLAVVFAGAESLASFMILICATIFLFGLLSPNATALALEPMGRIAGAAAAANGFVTTTGAAAIGALIGRFFNGTTGPIAAGFLTLGAAALFVAFATERGRLFADRVADAKAAQ